MAGAVLLAGATAPWRAQARPGANAMPEETAMAVPRLALPGGGNTPVSLPHPLDAEAASRIRRVFALQQAGDMTGAADATAGLEDETLLGDILADRYLRQAAGGTGHPGRRPDASCLRAWLKTYPTLPDAPAIHALLAGVSPRAAGIVPSSMTLGANSPASAMPEEADPASQAFRRNTALDQAVRDRSGSGRSGALGALRLIAGTRHLEPVYAAQLRAEVALVLFTGGETTLAQTVGQAAFAASGSRIGLAAYVAGLSAWRAGRPVEAGALFEQAAHADLTSVSVRAGAAFWAARVHFLQDDGAAAGRAWLRRAAAAPRTFYGLLAARRLGQQPMDAEAGFRLVSLSGQDVPDGFDPDPAEQDRPTLSEIDVDAVASNPAGRRAFALLQVGESGRAEATLRRLWPRVQNDWAMGRSIQLVAQAAGLTTLSAQLADILQTRDGQPRDAARFPAPKLSPHRGFTVNPALVYALTRLESNFDAGAVSGAGAHGLMQLMPTTAGFVLGHPDRFADNPDALHAPGLNLEIGQRYLTYLAGQAGIDGDLVRLLASYNAGPTTVSRWNESIGTGDPLLFMESLPLPETRDYVRRAFTYLWIYADRFGTPSPSLARLAAGEWPRFVDEQALTHTGSRVLH